MRFIRMTMLKGCDHMSLSAPQILPGLHAQSAKGHQRPVGHHRSTHIHCLPDSSGIGRKAGAAGRALGVQEAGTVWCRHRTLTSSF